MQNLCLKFKATPFPLADAHGNCVSFIDDAGNVQAHYTYDAFGGTASQTGAMADDFPFRFSSKYLDEETGLYYYGYRFYDSGLGRWLIRDVIDENGGLNLYGFVYNRSIDAIDPDGRCAALLLNPGTWAVVAEAIKDVFIVGGVIVTTIVVTEKREAIYQKFVEFCEKCFEDGTETKTETRTREETRTKDGPRIRKCLPCIPPAGTLMYEAQLTGDSHGGVPTPHSHPYIVNQNPTTCDCFINRCGSAALPGIWYPPLTPVMGGGYAP